VSPPVDTIPSLIPQSLLEALRNLDTPIDDGLNELAGETVSKRLGLSKTVAEQIERYKYDASQGVGVSREEAISVFRLVGRRPDAELVYADAGRRTARYAVRAAGLGTRILRAVSPRSLRRRIGVRQASKAARRVLGLELEMRHGLPEVRLTESLATAAGFTGTGCRYYSAVLAELLRLTSGFEGAMVHERCRSRGEDHCHWRAVEAGDYE